MMLVGNVCRNQVLPFGFHLAECLGRNVNNCIHSAVRVKVCAVFLLAVLHALGESDLVLALLVTIVNFRF